MCDTEVKLTYLKKKKRMKSKVLGEYAHQRKCAKSIQKLLLKTSQSLFFLNSKLFFLNSKISQHLTKGHKSEEVKGSKQQQLQLPCCSENPSLHVRLCCFRPEERIAASSVDGATLTTLEEQVRRQKNRNIKKLKRWSGSLKRYKL